MLNCLSVQFSTVSVYDSQADSLLSLTKVNTAPTLILYFLAALSTSNLIQLGQI